MGNTGNTDEGLKEKERNILIVEEKLKTEGYHRHMDHDLFSSFCRCLSQKKDLLGSYLSDHFEKALNLKKILDYENWKKREGKGGGKEEEEGEEDEEEGEGENEASKTKNVEFEELDEEKIKKLKEESKIYVRLIVSKFKDDPYYERFLSKTVLPIYNKNKTLSNARNYFFISCTIGPWKLEYLQTGVCVPRRMFSKRSVLCADLCEIRDYETFMKVRNNIADEIIKWNTKCDFCWSRSEKDRINMKKLSEEEETSTSTKEKKKKIPRGSYKDFVDSILECTGLENIRYREILKTYLQRTLKVGIGECYFEMDEKFVKEFGLDYPGKKKKKRSVVFKSHQQLDLFVINLMKQDPEFEKSHEEEYYLLKSFDRGFWMVYQRSGRGYGLQDAGSPSMIKRNERSSPLVDTGITVYVNEEEIPKLLCPFGHPVRETKEFCYP